MYDTLEVGIEFVPDADVHALLAAPSNTCQGGLSPLPLTELAETSYTPLNMRSDPEYSEYSE